MTSRVIGLGVLVATAVHANRVRALPRCRQRVWRASKASGSEETRHNLPRPPRECLTARLLLHSVTAFFRSRSAKSFSLAPSPGVHSHTLKPPNSGLPHQDSKKP